MTWRHALVALALVALAAAGGSAARAAGATGLTGIVMRGPTSPVCRVGSPCAAPAAGFVLVFSRGSLRVRTRTDARGRYRVALAPGLYAVRGPVQRAGGAVEPSRVRVRAGRLARVDFDVDTGIR